jgi:hypothetical protein
LGEEFLAHYMKNRVKYGCVGAILLGIFGFISGFIMPIIFMPTSNQGPLIGIFITGPGGVLLGWIIGFLYGFIKSNKSK